MSIGPDLFTLFYYYLLSWKSPSSTVSSMTVTDHDNTYSAKADVIYPNKHEAVLYVSRVAAVVYVYLLLLSNTGKDSTTSASPRIRF